MGRGDRPAAAGQVLRNVGPSHEVVVAEEALDELGELIEYIRKDSPKNAESVYNAVSERLHRLRTAPELVGHVDKHAGPLPPKASCRKTTVKKVAIYYAFPVARGSRQMVLVLSIRRGRRQPLEETQYTRRWLDEVSKVEAAVKDEQRT